MKLEKAVRIINNDTFNVIVRDEHFNFVTDFVICRDYVEDKTILKYPGCTYELFANSKVADIFSFVKGIKDNRVIVMINVRVKSKEIKDICHE